MTQPVEFGGRFLIDKNRWEVFQQRMAEFQAHLSSLQLVPICGFQQEFVPTPENFGLSNDGCSNGVRRSCLAQACGNTGMFVVE